MNRNRKFIWNFFLIVTCLIIGFYSATLYPLIAPKYNELRSGQNKLGEALDIINKYYVDTIDISHLTESAIEKIISELDPHSSYIPASDVDIVKEDLEVSFGGIGISFDLTTDTIVVLEVVSGGPSEKAGLMQFDRIITVDDSIIAGKSYSTNKVMRMLRGPKDSKVNLGIQRGNTDSLINFELIRGDIPNNTINASFKISENIGYIKINKFARSTYSEFLLSIAKLKQQDATGFIIDLRNNPGGLMDVAINMVNEFLPKGQMIVYTKGRVYAVNYFSNGRGTCQEAPIVVLIDEHSGSASEIFSGAMQDNDRGLIIGRRSFGKGLVQTKLDFSDKSELHLTIARYHTPSGRCIQKDYELGKSGDYGLDIQNRFLHGEFYYADSIIMNESLQFKTTGGRTVYGGGGIMPDIFVPSDTVGYTSYLSNLVESNVLFQFIINYSNNNYDLLKQFETYQELYEHLKQQSLISDLEEYAASKGIRKRPTLMNISRNIIETQIHANIVKNFFDYEGYYTIYLKDDAAVKKAVEVIEKSIWKPEVFQLQNDSEKVPQQSAYFPGKSITKQLHART